jgi:integrase
MDQLVIKRPAKARPFLTKDIAAAAKGDPVGRYELRDKKVTGLRLAVQPSGKRSWLLRYMRDGRYRKLTIGDYSDTLGLAEARDIAADKRLEVVKGGDPAADKAEARRKVAAGIEEGQLFSTAWTAWTEAPKPKSRNSKGWRKSTADRVKRLYDARLEPIWGKRKLVEIAKPDVTAFLNPIARKHPHSAARIASVLATFFSWCVAEGRLDRSPCEGIEKAKGNKRRRKLTDDELRWLWKACEREPFPMGYLVKLLLLTLARRTEGAAMRVREIHKGNRRVWIIPPERAKNNREHEIFLTDAMLAILDAIPRIKNKAGYVFCTNGKTPFSGYSKAKKKLDSIMLEIAREEHPEITAIPNWTLHDLRRTGATRMQRLGFDSETVDGCLNHADDDAYLQHDFEDEKSRAFQAWSSELLRMVAA